MRKKSLKEQRKNIDKMSFNELLNYLNEEMTNVNNILERIAKRGRDRKNGK